QPRVCQSEAPSTVIVSPGAETLAVRIGAPVEMLRVSYLSSLPGILTMSCWPFFRAISSSGLIALVKHGNKPQTMNANRKRENLEMERSFNLASCKVLVSSAWGGLLAA